MPRERMKPIAMSVAAIPALAPPSIVCAGGLDCHPYRRLPKRQPIAKVFQRRTSNWTDCER